MRIRGYNKKDKKNKVFLEIKKKYEQPIFKNRAPLRYKDLARLFKGVPLEEVVKNTNRFPQAEDDAKRFFFHLHRKHMRPVVTVIYEREAYEDRFPNPQNNLRITLDKNLRAVAYPLLKDLYSEKRKQWVLRDHFIMEVKFNHHRPQWIQPLLEAIQLRREAASKYCLSIDALPSIRPRAEYDTYSYGQFLPQKRR